MRFLDAFSAKDGQVVGAVEVLDSLLVGLADLVLQVFFQILFIELHTLENRVLLHNFIEDIDVQRKSVHGIQVLYELSAEGTSHPHVMMQVSQALGAKSVAAMNKNSWDSFPYIILEPAEVAVVQHPRVVVSHDQGSFLRRDLDLGIGFFEGNGVVRALGVGL